MSGAIAKNPQRFRDREPEPTPTAELGKVPKHLSPEQRKVWKEIADNAPPGTLYNSDRIAVEMAARLVVQLRAGLLTKASEMSVLVSLLARLGMTPADRTKLAPEPQKDKTPPKDEWSFTSGLRGPSSPLRAVGDQRQDTGEQVDAPRLPALPN